MSHISKIELVIDSIIELKEACKRLGLEFAENQKSYKWYQQTSPCDHAIKVPDCSYEIGVIKKDKSYTLHWDSYYKGGLEKKIGKDTGLLKQAYAAIKIRTQAILKKYHVAEQKIKTGIRLTLTV